MAELTNVDGITFFFDPTAVTAVADHDGDAGAAVTTVYGLAPGRLRITEAVTAFLQENGLSGSFAKLTTPAGNAVWLNVKVTSLVRPPLAEEYPPTVGAVITVGGTLQTVKESPSDARAALKTAGANL